MLGDHARQRDAHPSRDHHRVIRNRGENVRTRGHERVEVFHAGRVVEARDPMDGCSFGPEFPGRNRSRFQVQFLRGEQGGQQRCGEEYGSADSPVHGQLSAVLWIDFNALRALSQKGTAEVVRLWAACVSRSPSRDARRAAGASWRREPGKRHPLRHAGEHGRSER